jgi:hypothetical protein
LSVVLHVGPTQAGRNRARLVLIPSKAPPRPCLHARDHLRGSTWLGGLWASQECASLGRATLRPRCGRVLAAAPSA